MLSPVSLCHEIFILLRNRRVAGENFINTKYLVKSGISEMSDSLYHIYRYHISRDLVDVPLLNAVLHGDMRRREGSRP